LFIFFFSPRYTITLHDYKLPWLMLWASSIAQGSAAVIIAMPNRRVRM